MTAAASPAPRSFEGQGGDKALSRFLAVSAAAHVLAWGVATYRRPAPPPPPETRAALSVRSGDDEAPPDFMLYVTQAEMMRGTEEQLAKSFEGAAPKTDRTKDPESVLLSELTDSPPEPDPAPAASPAARPKKTPPAPDLTERPAPPPAPRPSQTRPEKAEPAPAAPPPTAPASETPPTPVKEESLTPEASPPPKDAAPAGALPPPPVTGATENSYAMDGGGDFGAIYTYGVKAVSSSGESAPAPVGDESPARRNYEHLLTTWISKFQRPPAQDVHGEGVLLFGVTRKGYVSVVSVIKSAGIAMLDEAAVNMIHEASPVIAPPPEYMPDEAVIYFAVPFRF